MISFKNKNILITGATGGIGNELVKKFISLGGNVLGSGTKSEKLGWIIIPLGVCVMIIGACNNWLVLNVHMKWKQTRDLYTHVYLVKV